MIFNMKINILLLTLLFTSFSFAGVYKWVDEEGRIHYGDRKSQVSGKKINLPALTAHKLRLNEAQSKDPKETDSGDYARLDIVSPKQEEIIRNDNGEMLIQVVLEPTLSKGHYIKVLLNGVALPQKLTTTSGRFNGISRGTHQVSVQIFNKEDEQLKTSESVTFSLRKASLLEKKTP